MLSSFFFFNDTATTEIYTLSLHDALPISRVATHQMIVGIDNFQRDGFARCGAQIVIEDGTVGWILSRRNIRRERSIRVAVPAKTNRFLRLVQRDRSLRDFRPHLAQRSYVVENPERAAVRADDEIVAMNWEVAHGGVGQVELQGVAVVAFIERNKNRAFRTGKKQPFAPGVFAHRVAR